MGEKKSLFSRTHTLLPHLILVGKNVNIRQIRFAHPHSIFAKQSFSLSHCTLYFTRAVSVCITSCHSTFSLSLSFGRSRSGLFCFWMPNKYAKRRALATQRTRERKAEKWESILMLMLSFYRCMSAKWCVISLFMRMAWLFFFSFSYIRCVCERWKRIVFHVAQSVWSRHRFPSAANSLFSRSK